MKVKTCLLPFAIVCLFAVAALSGLAIRHRSVMKPMQMVGTFASAAGQAWMSSANEPIAVIGGTVEFDCILAGPKIDAFVESWQLATRRGEHVDAFCQQLPATNAVD